MVFARVLSITFMLTSNASLTVLSGTKYSKRSKVSIMEDGPHLKFEFVNFSSIFHMHLILHLIFKNTGCIFFWRLIWSKLQMAEKADDIKY